MTRFDLLSPRPRKDGKTYWHKVGAAFEARNGGYQLVFDSLPTSDAEGRTTLMMKEYTPRKEDPAEAYNNASHGGGEIDDEIPF